MSRSAARGLLAALLTAALLAVPLRADAWSTRGEIRTIVTAEADTAAERVSRAELDVHLVRGNELDAGNGALAYSHCDGCETVAAALQVVVLSSTEPDVDIHAQNEALAVNEACADCRSLAAAHQFVVVTPGYAFLKHEGWEKVRSLRDELGTMLETPTPLDQLDADVATLAKRLKRAVLRSLVVIRPDQRTWTGKPRLAKKKHETRTVGSGWWHGPRAS